MRFNLHAPELDCFERISPVASVVFKTPRIRLRYIPANRENRIQLARRRKRFFADREKKKLGGEDLGTETDSACADALTSTGECMLYYGRAGGWMKEERMKSVGEDIDRSPFKVARYKVRI